MFNPDLKKLLKGCNSRYSLVVGTAKRAREIAQEFEEQGIITDEKPVLLAIEDFKNHKYNLLEPEDEE